MIDYNCVNVENTKNFMFTKGKSMEHCLTSKAFYELATVGL